MHVHTARPGSGTSPARLRALLAGLLAIVMTVALLPPQTSTAQEAGPVEIKLLATNDFHGRLKPPSGNLGGAAYLATHIDSLRTDNTLYVDAGDTVGATPVLSNLFYDEPAIEVMNIMGLDVQSVGNHEFDRGQTEILRRAEGGCLGDECDYRGDVPFEGSDFTTLSTNVIFGEDHATGTAGETLMPPYEVFEVDGVNVGFLGVTTVNTPNVVHPRGIEGLEFLPEAEAVNEWVPYLKDELDVDVVVVLMHEGARQEGQGSTISSCENLTGAAVPIIEQFDEDVDVVITGHSHQAYVCDRPGEPLITQAFEYGKTLTEIDLTVDPLTGEILTRSARNHDVTRTVAQHPAVAELIEFYDEISGPLLAEVVGYSEVPVLQNSSAYIRLAERPLGNLATDALVQQYETDFAFQNSGGLRANLTNLPKNEDGLYPIRREDVLGVWPFGNIVALAEVDGPTLKAMVDNGVKQVGGGRFMQIAGLRVDYYIDGTDGGFPRGVIRNVEYWNHPEHEDGTPVDLSAEARHTVALNDFMAAGGDGYPNLNSKGMVYSLQDPLEVAVERYLEEESPVSPVVEGRIAPITGDVVLQKAVTGAYAPADWEFEFDLTCTGWDNRTVTLSKTTPSKTLPATAGSRCTAAERSPSGASTTVVNNQTRTSLNFGIREAETFDVRFTNRFDEAPPALAPDYRTSAFVRYATAAGWQTHVTGDLKGDGRDAVLSYHPNRGRWWMTSWDDTADEWKTELVATYGTTTGWQTHLAGDITGNGNDDLISYHPKRGRWWVTTWDEGAGAWDTFLLTTYGTPTGWQTHLVGDVVGDEGADLLSYHPKRGRWWVTYWDEDEEDFVSELFTTYATTTGWQTHLTGDVTGNGYDDLLSYHPQRGRWWVTTWDEDEEELVTELYTTYDMTTGWAAHLAGDVTGDGYADLLGYRPDTGRWWLTSWDEDAGELITRRFTTYATRTGWDAHVLGDVTGNGRADLLSYYNNGRWSITTDVNDPGTS
jgi:5'-nucleotidase